MEGMNPRYLQLKNEPGFVIGILSKSLGSSSVKPSVLDGFTLSQILCMAFSDGPAASLIKRRQSWMV